MFASKVNRSWVITTAIFNNVQSRISKYKVIKIARVTKAVRIRALKFSSKNKTLSINHSLQVILDNWWVIRSVRWLVKYSIATFSLRRVLVMSPKITIMRIQYSSLLKCPLYLMNTLQNQIATVPHQSTTKKHDWIISRMRRLLRNLKIIILCHNLLTMRIFWNY